MNLPIVTLIVKIPAQMYDIDNQGRAVRYEEFSDDEEVFDEPGGKNTRTRMAASAKMEMAARIELAKLQKLLEVLCMALLEQRESCLLQRERQVVTLEPKC